MPRIATNQQQSDFPGIEVHIFENIQLGGTKQPTWLQEHMIGPYWRVYWNNQPGAFIRVGHNEFELKPDSITVLSPNTIYNTRLIRPIKHFYVHFSVGRPYSQTQPALVQLNDDFLIHHAQQLAAYADQAHNNYRTHIRLHRYLCDVLLKLPDSWIPPLTEYDPRISHAMTTLENTLGTSNRQLAQHAKMSTNGFLHLFKKQTGVSPQMFARKKRLEQAAILLHYSCNSIEEIAEKTGFSDRYHLSKSFKKEYRIGPSRFRKNK
jgi:AraC-like DNA-binding protein